MPWIPSHSEIANHPKVRRLSRIIGASLPQTIGHLHLLWWWAQDYTPDGNLSDYDEIEIAEAMRWEGDPFVLIDALEQCRLLEDKTIHDWQDYGGRFREERIKERERSQRRRDESRKTNSTGGRPEDDRWSTGGRREETRQEEIKGEERRQDIPRLRSVKPTDDPEFDVFWQEYPNKDGKANAVKAWTKLKPDSDLASIIVNAVQNQRDTRKWQQGYVMEASRWLNEQRWQDVVRPASQIINRNRNGREMLTPQQIFAMGDDQQEDRL